MIISRTPFRISFFGGGTDYGKWLEENKGAVLSTTINKYCYITCRYLPPFFEHKSRIIYSKMEHVHTVDEIDHPSVREVLKFLHIDQGIEIHHDGDLPARTGLGSSSSFTVGLLNSLYALIGRMPSKAKLAQEAIFIEQTKCKENVGCQDQIAAAYGGLNFMEFVHNQSPKIQTMILPKERVVRLENNLLLYFTGFSRTASEIAAHQIQNIPNRKKELQEMYQMTLQAVELLKGDRLVEFGELLHESWMLKRTLSDKISTSQVDEIYEAARSAGALGGKLLGAGGGGFILIYALAEHQPAIKEKLKKLLCVPIHFEFQGSQIVFYQPPNGDNPDAS